MESILSNWKRYLYQRLTPISGTASLDAQVLIAHVLERSRAWVMAHPEFILTLEKEDELRAALARLEAGEPLPYILGHWEFYGLDFILSPATLIPRSETELLVEQALSWLRGHPERRWVADIGAGSGCIAVSLAVNMPGLRVLATDISLPALQIASRNVHLHKVLSNVFLIRADLLPTAEGQFDLVCANLPYIPAGRLKKLQVSRFEPWIALDGGIDGLDLLKRLLDIAPQRLAAAGILLLEIDASQGEAACRMANLAFPGADVRIIRDLAGHDRLLRVQT